ncbi:PREDICTED: guanine nucleotide-binding protein subunit gamma-1-like [Ceratosolen solmsi marchali]|uniref:Guanine nucleotide-binding protein subunit gamma-1-like n=1 Tax=Ceratosolen solmsi marchali TaxID=326594 RepID=A0AAJ6YGS6_9HYME|nr:PREDICTED: guanine nucleotide-binding protein subunit gamma-1-like [Ceratosolen solmsi marchali]
MLKSRRRENNSRDCGRNEALGRDLERIIKESGVESCSARRSRRAASLVKRVRDHAQRQAGIIVVMDMVISNLQQQRQLTEQLRREAAVKRVSVSKAVEDLMKYIVEHEQEDCLLVGFSSQKSNPFREKSSCSIL